MSLPPAPACDHLINLFYDFRCDAAAAEDVLPRLQLSAVAQHGWIDPSRGNDERCVWNWVKWNVSADLHPSVRNVLNAFAAANSIEADEASPEPLCLTASAETLNLLLGRYRRPTPPDAETGQRQDRADALALVMPRKHDLAADVLQAPCLVTVGGVLGARLHIDRIDIHLFRTGVGLAVASLRIAAGRGSAPLDASVIVSAMPMLADERRDAALGWMDSWTEPASRFKLGVFVRRLIAPIVAPGTPDWRRIYSYCSLVFHKPIDDTEAREIAFRLSRHYNMRYQTTPDMVGTEFVKPFATVLHAVSREGSATLVNGTSDSAGTPAELLANWTAQSHPGAYLPLQVVALHERIVLLDLAQTAARRIPASGTAALDTAPLRDMCRRFLLFRLHYRFAQVSGITMHDLVYQAISRAFGLVDISEKINRDLIAVERRLVEEEVEMARLDRERERAARIAELEASRAERRRIEREYAFYAGLGGAGLAYLTVSGVFEHLAGFAKGLISNDISWHLGIEVLGQVVALSAAWFGWRYALRHQHSGASHEEDLAEEALNDVRLTAAEAEAQL